MLNVSATQELAKKVAQLEAENQVLKAQVARIDQLEKILMKMQIQDQQTNSKLR